MINQLVYEFKKNGGVFNDNLKIKKNIYGFGLYANKKIFKNEELISLPVKLVVDEKKFNKLYLNNKNTFLIEYFKYIKKFCFLDSNFSNHPLNFNNEELKLFKLIFKNHIIYKDFIKKFRKYKNLNIFKKKVYLLFNQRALNLKKSYNIERALIPMIDFINHGDPNVKIVIGLSSKSIKIKSIKNVNSNQQLFLNYNKRNILEFFLQYGFVSKNNKTFTIYPGQIYFQNFKGNLTSDLYKLDNNSKFILNKKIEIHRFNKNIIDTLLQPLNIDQRLKIMTLLLTKNYNTLNFEMNPKLIKYKYTSRIKLFLESIDIYKKIIKKNIEYLKTIYQI